MGLLRPIGSLALSKTRQQDPDRIQHAYCESNTRWVSRRLRLALAARRCAKVLRLEVVTETAQGSCDLVQTIVQTINYTWIY